MSLTKPLAIFCCLGLAAGCDIGPPPDPGIGRVAKWSELEGWENDRLAETWPALLRSCSKLQDEPPWSAVCREAEQTDAPTDNQAREFYERWFNPHEIYAEGGSRDGLITGYYEPLLYGSLDRSERFRFPVYGRPGDLLIVDLSELYPELEGKRIRGRLEGNKVVPYYSRSLLQTDPTLLNGDEIVWVDDPVALFFLHIQGSGRIRLTDGSVLGIGYADQNGHPYRSIGRELIELGELKKEDVNLFSIRGWLGSNPDRVNELFDRNPSYVFFSLRSAPEGGPYGSLGVPLIAERSIAVDRNVIPLGVPLWLDTSAPDTELPYRRLVMAQDTGGAIKGHVRADLFWGHGERAERMAGLMKQKGRMYALLPKEKESN